MKSTRCVSLKFKTTILNFIFKSTNQVFPQVVCRLATFFINNLHWSLSFSRHAGRAYLFLKLTVWTCVFHHTPTLGSISHMFQQPMKVASIIGFYILTSFNRTQWLIFKFRTTNIRPTGNWNPTGLTQSQDLAFSYFTHINIKKINYFLLEMSSPFKDQKCKLI